MSTDIYKRIGSYPERFKKKGMWLNNFGNQHLSDKSVAIQSSKKAYSINDVAEIAGFFAIASVMSLWRNSKQQQQQPCLEGPCQFEVPSADTSIRHSDKLDGMRLKTAAPTTTSRTTGKPPPSFQRNQGNRSNVQSLCISSSRQTFNQPETTGCTVYSKGRRLNGLEIQKDFGTDQTTNFAILRNALTINALVSAGQLLQNCGTHTLGSYGICETVVTSKATRQSESKSLNENSATFKNYETLTVLGIVPILSCAIQVNKLSELLLSQTQAIKNLITCAITVRLILLGTVLKEYENLQQSESTKVNKTDIFKPSANNIEEAEENIKSANNSASITTASVNNAVPNNMAMANNNHNNAFDLGGNAAGRWGEEDEDEYMSEEEEGQMGLRDVPNVPDFRDIVNDGDDDDDLLADGVRGRWDRGIDDLLAVVPEFARGIPEPSNLCDEFANELICDPEVFAALVNPNIAPAPHDGDPYLPAEEEEMEDLGDFAANAG